jgi:hypothetical protein
MKASKKEMLRILGRVSSSILKKLFQGKEFRKQNAEWLFADYAASTYEKGTTFDIIVPANGVDWNHEYKIKLLKITDEYGRTFSQIPEGYKTICQFEFSPNVPQFVRQLPLLQGWVFNKHNIYLCQHSDINLLMDETNRKQEYIFLDLFMTELRRTQRTNRNRISIPGLLQILQDSSTHESDDLLQMIINTMVLSGRAKKENDELVLIEK